ncbi:hypothetical protein H8959_011026 [Pygathrix nigripes]
MEDKSFHCVFNFSGIVFFSSTHVVLGINPTVGLARRWRTHYAPLVGLDLLAPAVNPEGTDATWRQREAPAQADAQPRKQARRKPHAQARAEGSAGARLRAQEAGAATLSPPGRPPGLLAPPERPAAATPRRRGKAAAGSEGPNAGNTRRRPTGATAAASLEAQFYKGALSRITLRVSFRAGPALLLSRPGRRARSC